MAEQHESRSIRRAVVHARYGHPLRFYILCCFVKYPASRSQAHFVSVYRFAPWRVYKTHNMQSGLRWFCGWRGAVAYVRRCAQRVDQFSPLPSIVLQCVRASSPCASPP